MMLLFLALAFSARAGSPRPLAFGGGTVRELLILVAAALLFAVPAAEAKPAAAKKCAIKRVYPNEAYAGGPVPVGQVRVRRIPCRAARTGMANWFNAFQERLQAGRQAKVIYIEADGRSFRCVYRQTAFGTDKYGNSINPYAVVKCRAVGGVRLYFEGYA